MPTDKLPLSSVAGRSRRSHPSPARPDSGCLTTPSNTRTLPLISPRSTEALRCLRVSLDYTRHDLRRTVATGLQSLNVPTSTITHVLNQQEDGPRATKIYARHDFSEEKKTALEAWGRHLDALLTGQTSRVVPFAGKRR